jgi:membrane peptidoglycan carboxypeptidase
MATAVSSVANGGTLYEPRIVRAIIKDGQRAEIPHKALRRTVSERTAAQLTAMMEAVVDRGTAKAAQIDGYTIAGKTGTAQKIVNGAYSQSEYNASFVGFVPSRKPRLTVIVVIDSPHGKGYYGGVVAAPIFKRVAEASLRHLGIAPTVNPQPPVLVSADAGEGGVGPGGGRITPVRLVAAPERQLDGLMPDLSGLSAREANRTLTRLGMTGRFSGDGFVIEQSPAAGTVLVPGTACTLMLGRQPPSRSGAPQ